MSKLSYTKQRYITYAIITAFVMVVPFIRIDDAHLFLLSFDKMQLHLLGVAFDMQELYLLPFLFMLLFLGIFFITTFGGRIWCGWGCPQTIFRVIYRDWIETKLLGLRKSLKNKQREPDMSKSENKVKKALAIIIWSALSLLASANFLWYFVPPEDFFAYMANPSEHTMLLGFFVSITLFLIYDVIYLKEDFCVYICPYSRVQSVMYDDDTVMTVYDEGRGGNIYKESGDLISSKPENGECAGCEACVKICPTHIDIRKGLQLECINCLECSDACNKVMGALGKKSLVNWSSDYETKTKKRTRYFRFRTTAYLVALALVFIGLVLMSGTKEHMLLNINKTTQLYSIKEGNKIENAYTFLFQNTDTKEHKYYFEISNPDIKIKRPSKPFKLLAGQKMKKIVVLETDKVLIQNSRKDTPIKIDIKAYAVDNKEQIVVHRDTVFIYPRYDLLKD